MAERRPAISDILECLTNEEIERRLVQHGYPSTPVTSSNRAAMLTELRQLLSQVRIRRQQFRRQFVLNNNSVALGTEDGADSGSTGDNSFASGIDEQAGLAWPPRARTRSSTIQRFVLGLLTVLATLGISWIYRLD